MPPTAPSRNAPESKKLSLVASLVISPHKAKCLLLLLLMLLLHSRAHQSIVSAFTNQKAPPLFHYSTSKKIVAV